ncbi:MAG: type I glyceraldehyde-3-phosphate dehydrogenase [Patescibacteria group bacterium]
MTKIAINGFGRIGRAAFAAAADLHGFGDRRRRSERINADNLKVVAINDLVEGEQLANLLKYDSVYGVADKDITAETSSADNFLKTGRKKIRLLSEKDPAELPWRELGVDIVLECSGVFTEFEQARKHISAGARKVIISANGKGEGLTVVLGTSGAEDKLKIASSDVVSNASCTTNCIAPIMQILNDEFGVSKSLMTTNHAYTSTQNLVDGPSRKDMRRARAAAVNAIPTTTGSAVAAGKVVPEIDDKFDGIAVRVPVPCGSLSDITALLEERVTVEKVNQAFEDAETLPRYRGIVEYSEDPLVSSDIIGNPYSAVFDSSFTRVVGGNLVKLLAWYDNEWAYACRLVELAQLIGEEIS